MLPVPAGEEVAPKIVRLLYFIGPAVLCTVAINKWKGLERQKSNEEQQISGTSLENPSDVIQKAVE